MKKIICLLLIIFIIPACAEEEFQIEFNNNLTQYNVQPLYRYESDGDVFYMSGMTFVYYSDEMITVIGEESIKTLAVACCAFRYFDKEESGIEQCGRIMMAYFMLKRQNDKNGISVLPNRLSIIEQIQDEMLIISMVK